MLAPKPVQRILICASPNYHEHTRKIIDVGDGQDKNKESNINEKKLHKTNEVTVYSDDDTEFPEDVKSEDEDGESIDFSHQLDLPGVVFELSELYKEFIKVGCRGEAASGNWRRSMWLKKIKIFLDTQTKKASNPDERTPVTEYILCFSGHGVDAVTNPKIAGDWIVGWNFKDKYISLKEILKIWSRSKGFRDSKATLLIIADCCYSSRWVDRANHYYDTDKYHFKSVLKRVLIQATTDDDIDDGTFFPPWVAHQFQNFPYEQKPRLFCGWDRKLTVVRILCSTLGSQKSFMFWDQKFVGK